MLLTSFSLKVALQLLDSDFHDENIREFAVEVLERKLLDEDIEDYLLQLTQVKSCSNSVVSIFHLFLFSLHLQ